MTPLAALQALVALSELDILYADVYLQRAEVLLAGLLSPEEYDRLTHVRAALRVTTGRLQDAVARGEWPLVLELADEAERCKVQVDAAHDLLEVADVVRGPRVMCAGAMTLAFNGLVTQPALGIEREREGVVDRLRRLAGADAAWRTFYSLRAAHFERLDVVSEEEAVAQADEGEFRSRILAAVETGHFAEVQRLADAMRRVRGPGLGRIRVPVAEPRSVHGLSAAFPAGAQARARELGLLPETLPEQSELNEYLGCCCGERAVLPANPLTETDRRPAGCTCGHACPPGVRAPLRETLDLLLVHPFMSSGGVRYLPWFGAEALLVETFSETQPEAPGGLLGALGLPGRRGLSRLAIEDALRRNTAGVVSWLGLDPVEFVVACIPFDAYLRLAPRYGWGTEPLWTHFDGYQITREFHLRALVGGDVRYGGPDDLCSVGRAYDAERLTARFAVLRRQRFMARQAGEPLSPREGR